MEAYLSPFLLIAPGCYGYKSCYKNYITKVSTRVEMLCNLTPNCYISYEGNPHQLARQIKTTEGDR